MDYINWTAHGKAIARMPARKTQLTKMCHEILPTASITNQSDTNSSPMCPYCKTVEEDQDLVMKCDHSSKLNWRLKCITSIRKQCSDMKMREMLTTILTDGIQAWYTEATLQPGTYPASVPTAYSGTE
jgi:hypothetical protein